MINSKKIENKRVTLTNNSKVDLNGVNPGESISVEVDRNGKPLERFWRDRVRDAEYDGCVTIDKKAANKKAAENKGE